MRGRWLTLTFLCLSFLGDHREDVNATFFLYQYQKLLVWTVLCCAG